jgi:ribonuclease HI
MGGCNNNNNNNNNNKLIRLYGKVSVRKCKNFLQNRKGTRSNNTAELSGIAEAILYGLQELRKPNPPRIKEFMIRPDSEYAQLSVQGLTQPAENIQMVQEIKRHYADLKSVCAAQDINITWLHVPAHEHFRWNDLADEIAKDASRPNKLQHVRASARNERTPTPDPRGTFRNEQIRAAPVRHPQFIPPIDNMQVPDHLDVPEDADLFETYATTPIHLIPAEHIGILCALAPTKNITKKSIKTCEEDTFMLQYDRERSKERQQRSRLNLVEKNHIPAPRAIHARQRKLQFDSR